MDERLASNEKDAVEMPRPCLCLDTCNDEWRQTHQRARVAQQDERQASNLEDECSSHSTSAMLPSSNGQDTWLRTTGCEFESCGEYLWATGANGNTSGLHPEVQGSSPWLSTSGPLAQSGERLAGSQKAVGS